MIHDARVLQDEFIPKEVRHRDQEMNALTRALDLITRNEPAETTFLFGPSGAGKTCLARFALDKLREAVIDLNHQYVNCWQDYTRFRALYRILDALAVVSERDGLRFVHLLQVEDIVRTGNGLIPILDQPVRQTGALSDSASGCESF